MKVLVVCHGNVYRSPFAAAVMHYYGDPSLLEVRSGGFVNPGKVANKQIRLAAQKRGYGDLSDHRSKLVTLKDIHWSDIVLFMDNGNYRRLMLLYKEDRKTIFPLGSYLKTPIWTIKDPGFMKKDSAEFKVIIDQLEEASRNFIYQYQLDKRK